jgi:flagellar hook-length control protein FliK
MSPSLPSLSASVVTLSQLSAASSNIQKKQIDSSISSGFGGLLNETYSSVPPGASEGAATALDDAKVAAELQALPLDGKLLPLLQHTLASVAGAGIDVEQFVERLASKLKVLTQDSATGPGLQLATALQQLLQNQPDPNGLLPGGALAVLGRLPDSQTGPSLANTGNANETALAHRLAELIQQRASAADANRQPYGQLTAGRDGSVFTPDTALTQLQQPMAVDAQADPDMAVLLAAFKRLASNDRSASPIDSPIRTDSAVSGPAAPNTAASTASPQTPGMPTVTVTTPFGQADWDQALGERIQWLAGQKAQGAQLKLNPANLGPLEVRIQMQNDQASIQFTAHHALVREALEAALPRLREMLEASGVQLVDVDVSGHDSFAGRQQAARDDQTAQWVNDFDGSQSSDDIRMHTPLASLTPRGRLDLFA